MKNVRATDSIENKNNPPLEIKGIRLQWVQRHIYFVALDNAAKYFLCFGNNIVSKPDYDLPKFINQNNWFEQKYENLNAASLKENANYARKIPADKKARLEKIVLIAVVILLVIGIGYWLYSLARKTEDI